MSRTQNNESTKERILKAAIEEFGKHDYASASTNEMCKNHGISKGIIFHHFKNKDELFLKCLETGLEALVAYIETHYKKIDPSIEANLNHYFKVRHTFFIEHPAYESIFKSAMFHPPVHLKKEIVALKSPLKALNCNILMDLLKEQRLKEGLTQEQVIEVILSFFDYLLVAQPDISNACLEKQMIDFIKMLFWGVLN